MIKLSHAEQAKFARYVGVAAALFEHGYSEESIKLALDQSIPEGLVKEAFGGALARGAVGLGKWLIRGARGARSARVGAQALKAGGKAGKAVSAAGKPFNVFENMRRGVGSDFLRWGMKPTSGAWETAKGIGGNMIFPGLLKSKSTIGKGIGTGIFAKSMLGGFGGGSAPPPQPSTYGY